MNKKIVTRYMANSNRMQAKDNLNVIKYTNMDDGLNDNPDKMHEIAAYNLLLKIHLSVTHKLSLIAFSNKTRIYTWQVVKR